jgi:hypothetical protein
MGGILIGLKLSMLMVGKGEYDNPAYDPTTAAATGAQAKLSIPGRTDFQLTVPLNFGGSGFGFDLQPSLGFGDATTVGLYLGLAYHLEINPKLYLNFGLGPQVRYWLSQSDLPANTDLDLGADVHGRIPVGATYYAAPDLGLFAELGLGFGAQGAAYSTTVAGVSGTSDFKFGTGYAFDIGVGIRWP